MPGRENCKRICGRVTIRLRERRSRDSCHMLLCEFTMGTLAGLQGVNGAAQCTLMTRTTTRKSHSSPMRRSVFLTITCSLLKNRPGGCFFFRLVSIFFLAATEYVLLFWPWTEIDSDLNKKYFPSDTNKHLHELRLLKQLQWCSSLKKYPLMSIRWLLRAQIYIL